MSGTHLYLLPCLACAICQNWLWLTLSCFGLSFKMATFHSFYICTLQVWEGVRWGRICQFTWGANRPTQTEHSNLSQLSCVSVRIDQGRVTPSRCLQSKKKRGRSATPILSLLLAETHKLGHYVPRLENGRIQLPPPPCLNPDLHIDLHTDIHYGDCTKRASHWASSCRTLKKIQFPPFPALSTNPTFMSKHVSLAKLCFG